MTALLTSTLAGGSAAAAQDPTPSVLGGSIVDANGVGVTEVKVDLFDQGENGRRGQFLASTRSDGDGSFAFELNPGCFVLTVISPDERRFDGSRWFQPSVCVEAGQQVTDVVARFDAQRDAALGGTVTARLGTPVAGVKANLFTQGRTRFLGLATTDSNGVFAFDVAAGCYVITVLAPPDDTFVGGSRFFQRNICLSAGQENTDLVATLDITLIEPATIGGVVISAVDQGVEGVRITAYRATESGGRGEFLGRTFTGADGRWSFDVTDGCYRFIAIAPDNDGFGPTFNRYYEFGIQCVDPTEQILTLEARLRQPDGTGVSMTTGRSFLEGPPGQTKTAMVKVSLEDRVTFPLTVNLRTLDGTATAADSDFGAVDIDVRFEPGEVTKTIPVTIYGDDQTEGTERFFLVLSDPSAGLTIRDDIFPVFILNDDGFDPVVGLAAVGITVDEDTPQPRTISVGLAAPATEKLTVDLRTVDLTATAAAGDYDPIDYTLRFEPGQQSVDVEIRPRADGVVESDEAFFLVLSNPSTGLIIGNSTMSVTITDADRPFDAPTAGFRPSTGNTSEGFPVTVSLDDGGRPLDGDRFVRVTSLDGSATAASGDYTPIDEVVNVSQDGASVTLITGDNDIIERDETMFLVLSEPSTGVLLERSVVAITISDDDRFTPTIPTVSARNDTFNESDGTVSARLYVSLASPGSVDVTTISITATPDEDYRAITTRVDLPEAGGDFSVPLEILDDDVAESGESFFVVVSNPSPGISIGEPFGIIRIRDDDFGR